MKARDWQPGAAVPRKIISCGKKKTTFSSWQVPGKPKPGSLESLNLGLWEGRGGLLPLLNAPDGKGSCGRICRSHQWGQSISKMGPAATRKKGNNFFLKAPSGSDAFSSYRPDVERQSLKCNKKENAEQPHWHPACSAVTGRKWGDGGQHSPVAS